MVALPLATTDGVKLHTIHFHLKPAFDTQMEPWLADLGSYLQARGAGSPDVVADIIDRYCTRLAPIRKLAIDGFSSLFSLH